MSKPVKTCKKEALLRDVINTMDEDNIGVVVVAEGHNVIGVITERDIIRRVVSKDLNIDKIKVEEVMTKHPVTIHHDGSILEATRLMSENNFRRLIVTNKGKLVGLITAKDVIEVLSA
jgi:CBS domain-containing protein